MEPLRIHSNLLNGILEILKESFSSKIYAHRIIENQLKSKKNGAQGTEHLLQNIHMK